MRPFLNNVLIEKFPPSQDARLYEILTPASLFYTDKSGGFVLFGAVMVDCKTKANLPVR